MKFANARDFSVRKEKTNWPNSLNFKTLLGKTDPVWESVKATRQTLKQPGDDINTTTTDEM